MRCDGKRRQTRRPIPAEAELLRSQGVRSPCKILLSTLGGRVNNQLDTSFRRNVMKKPRLIAKIVTDSITACLLFTLLLPATVCAATANVVVADSDWQPLSAQVK